MTDSISHSLNSHLTPSHTFHDPSLQTELTPAEIATIVQKILRVLERSHSRAEEALDAISDASYEAAIQELRSYCLTLSSTSSSINRLLYQLEAATEIDAIALLRSRQRFLSSGATSLNSQLYEAIQIRQCTDAIMVFLPYMPGRKQTDRQFIYDLMFQRLLDERPYPQWPCVHLLFTHVYPQAVSKFPKDVDNYNYKPAIDYLAAALSFSDSAWTCSLEKRAEFRDDLPSGVYIEITPRNWQSRLDRWHSLPATQQYGWDTPANQEG